ncbi:MAG: DUF4831 family protein [Alloprevotella sp.]|nr:DUF4831 family protein [Alloprevotella sp.]MBR1732268.1 DUF4831 family protein [Alloprevotella sp.]
MTKKLLFLTALLATNASAQTEVTEYKPGVTEDGITYFLPNTSLRVALRATRTTYTPGEFARYAERYLRLKDIPQTTCDEWTLDGADIIAYGTADPAKAYSIKFRPKTSAPLVGLAPDGRLLSICDTAPELPALPRPSVKRTSAPAEAADAYKTEEILAAGSEAKMAELAAAEIYDIRESRSALVKGQADYMPKDGEQLRLMLENLDRQEAGLLRLFTAATATEEYVFILDFTPGAHDADEILCRFSRHLGVVDKDDLAGEPVRLTVKALTPLPEAPQDAGTGAPDKKEAADLRYIVPGRAAVAVTYQRRELAGQALPLAQFGRVERLGGELFNKKYSTHIRFAPETGGILKIDTDEKP